MQKIFINRLLNMKKIKYIGLDMDHTLIRYHTQKFESLVYQFTLDYLCLRCAYPEEIRHLNFNFQDAIRGLVIDSKNGNILKLNRYGAIRQSFHGTQNLGFKKQNQFYRSIYVDLNDPNYFAIDTSFSIAFCVLYAQLIDFKDAHPAKLPDYEIIARDVLIAVDEVHSLGDMKAHIVKHIEEFVYRDPSLVEGIKQYMQHGKKVFILTNSDFHYSKLLLDYAINPFLEPGETWQSFFEFTITLANKPRFFYDKLQFLVVNPLDGSMRNLKGKIKPGIYQGGNANTFTQHLGLKGDEILYIGDHIYGDILRLKKDCNWRTALVVEELGHEIAAQEKAFPIEQELSAAMKVKRKLEETYNALQSKMLIHKIEGDAEARQDLQKQINAIDQSLTQLLQKQQEFYNPKWERIFRTGAEESYFANQVERYACIYMEQLLDLFCLPPLTYFRARRRLLAHDPDPEL